MRYELKCWYHGLPDSWRNKKVVVKTFGVLFIVEDEFYATGPIRIDINGNRSHWKNLDMDWDLKKAYEATIMDLEKAIRNSSWYEWAYRKVLRSEVNRYEIKISDMLDAAGELDL